MKTVRIVFRLVGALALSAWIGLLWMGIDSFHTGIQQQINGTRESNSFPYEAFGESCIEWACIWGGVSCAIIGYLCLMGIGQKKA